MLALNCKKADLDFDSPDFKAGVPRHVAMIMDGNGRWAHCRGLPRMEGHRKGVEALHRITKAAKELGVRYLTVYAFSTENWNRPLQEVNGLMNLIKYALKRELAELHKNKIRLHVIGQRERLPKDVVNFLEHALELTKNNDEFHLIIALNYGGRAEITQAVRGLAQQVKDGSLAPDSIDEVVLGRHLYTSSFPDPDLFIRTSGEKRISNFLLWQLCYTELVFTDTYWPDFDRKDLVAAIKQYQSRERRYGDVRR